MDTLYCLMQSKVDIWLHLWCIKYNPKWRKKKEKKASTTNKFYDLHIPSKSCNGKRTIAVKIHEDHIPNARNLFLSQRDERKRLNREGKDWGVRNSKCTGMTEKESQGKESGKVEKHAFGVRHILYIHVRSITDVPNQI